MPPQLLIGQHLRLTGTETQVSLADLADSAGGPPHDSIGGFCLCQQKNTGLSGRDLGSRCSTCLCRDRPVPRRSRQCSHPRMRRGSRCRPGSSPDGRQPVSIVAGTAGDPSFHGVSVYLRSSSVGGLAAVRSDPKAPRSGDSRSRGRPSRSREQLGSRRPAPSAGLFLRRR